MNPITHGLFGWALANTPAGLEKRDRAIIVAAALVPDLDGAGVILDIARGTTGTAASVYGEYHHVLCHNLGFGVLVALGAFAAGRRRALAAVLSFCAFLLHVAGDVAGSRGPEGEQWEIPFLWPFSNSVKLAWSGQWALDSWVNVAITMALLVLTFWLAWRRGYSPLEMVSRRADAAFVGALRNRFGTPNVGELTPGLGASFLSLGRETNQPNTFRAHISFWGHTGIPIGTGFVVLFFGLGFMWIRSTILSVCFVASIMSILFALSRRATVTVSEDGICFRRRKVSWESIESFVFRRELFSTVCFVVKERPSARKGRFGWLFISLGSSSTDPGFPLAARELNTFKGLVRSRFPDIPQQDTVSWRYRLRAIPAVLLSGLIFFMVAINIHLARLPENRLQLSDLPVAKFEQSSPKMIGPFTILLPSDLEFTECRDDVTILRSRSNGDIVTIRMKLKSMKPAPPQGPLVSLLFDADFLRLEEEVLASKFGFFPLLLRAEYLEGTTAVYRIKKESLTGFIGKMSESGSYSTYVFLNLHPASLGHDDVFQVDLKAAGPIGKRLLDFASSVDLYVGQTGTTSANIKCPGSFPGLPNKAGVNE